MKRRWTVLLAVLALLLAAAVQVSAAAEYVVDEADLLSSSEEQTLEQLAEDISMLYGCDICILTVDDYCSYGSGSVRSCAEQYFTANDLGQGGDKNGVLLMLSMAERDYALIAHGDIANSAFTDYGKDLLSEKFLDDFRYDDWYDGFYDYLGGCERLLDAAARGEPVDRSHSGGAIWVVLLVPLAVAGIACGVMAAMMKTARKKTQANAYIPDGGIRITGSFDRFINQTVVRQRIESSSSGGGTRVNSGGFSGKSGKF